MPNLGNDIKIRYGLAGGDQCYPYYIELGRKFTVKEFMERAVGDKNEWGSIHIQLPMSNWTDSVATLEYSHGDVVRGDISKYYDSVIDNVKGHGGWSASDYWIWIESDEKEDEEELSMYRIMTRNGKKVDVRAKSVSLVGNELSFYNSNNRVVASFNFEAVSGYMVMEKERNEE